MKMLTGKPAFPGVKHDDIFNAIKERKILWPEERKDFLEPMRLTYVERDLVDRMMQLDPATRLGGSIESMKELKKHPYFDGVDFDAVSRPNCRLALPLIEKLEQVEKAHYARISEEQKNA